MALNNGTFTSIEQITGQYLNQSQIRKPGAQKPDISFDEVLRSKSVQELKFSRHASERLLSRRINLSEEQMERLNDGTNRAREKGIKESLVIVDNLAFIVNVKNNTVVTAVGESDDKIFTNIDGAVIS